MDIKRDKGPWPDSITMGSDYYGRPITPPVTATPPSPASTTGTGSPVQTTQGSGSGPDVQPFQDFNESVPSTESIESPMDQGPQDSGNFWDFFQDLWTSLWGS